MNFDLTVWQRFVRWSAALVMFAGVFVVVSSASGGVSAAVPPVGERGAGHVTSDALPTVQHNGVVWDQAIIGNRVYAAGEFTKARPAGSAPGVNEVDRTHLLAYDIRTGELDLGFDVSLNAQVKTVTASPDGSVLYIGGLFTQVDGINRYRVAALDPVSGDPIAGFNAVVDYRVNSIVATADTVYVGGQFNSAGGNARSRLAAFSASNGSLLAWAPSADGEVHGMVLSPDGSKLIVGGKFGTLNGVQARGSGALDAVTGATLPWELNQTVAPYGDRAAFLDWTTDGTSVFGNAYHFGGSSTKFEGVVSVDPDDGSINWISDCHGDTYANAPMNGFVYSVSHAHYCSNNGGFPQTRSWSDNQQFALSMTSEAQGELRRDIWGYATYPGTPAPAIVNWAPDWQIGSYTSAGMAGWTVEGNGEYLIVGGEFLRVNNQAQQGLVRFAVAPTAPSAEGPRLGGLDMVPELVPTASGEVRVTFRSNYDRDNTALTYDIIRGGVTGSPISTQVVDSTYWNRPNVGYVDTGLAPGSTHTYRIRTTDPDGNVAWGNTVSVQASATGTPSAYADAVLVDTPTLHWRFRDQTGTTDDVVGVSNGIVASSVSRNEVGAINEPGDGAFGFTEATSSRLYDDPGDRKPVIDTYTLEAWVRTTSTNGGRIVGFSGSSTGTSSDTQSDRQIYMTNDGELHLGIRQSGSRLTASSDPGYNDGEWHHVVGTEGSNGLTLYVDGEVVDQRADAVAGANYYGYWRVGYDRVDNTWPGSISSFGFTGDIDEVAVYEHKVLTPQRVANHYIASGRATNNLAPFASFTSVDADLEVEFDAAGSNDPDGTIASYSWNFGDGSPAATGVQPTHTFGAAGTYEVTLTVTDDNGATATATATVTVGEANVAPVARFVSFASELDVEFDAAGSSDSDGTIVSYVWDFGDGTPAESGVSPIHAFATSGTYRVTLTVFDDDGASTETFEDISVAGLNNAPFAQFASSATFLEVGFDASGSNDPDGTIVSYSWDFGDGTAAGSGVAPTHTYSAAGTYSVTLTVSDDDGDSATQTTSVSVEAENDVPVAQFTSSAAFLEVGFDASGSNDPDGTIASYSWDFGDGTAAGSGVAPIHTYAAAGTYSVTLTVSDDDNATTSLVQSVMVEAENNAPVAQFTSSATFLDVDFDGAGSFDSDGTIATYSWDFGDGTPVGSGIAPSHSYATSGTYEVTLTVTDDENAVNTVINSTTVDAANVGPTAAFVSSVNGLSLDVDASTSSDTDGTIVTYEWNFGDGTAAGSGVTAAHTYASAGTFQVTLTITDDDGVTASSIADVTVVSSNVAPSAQFDWSTSLFDVDFDASDSSDDGMIVSYSWDFGDDTAAGSGVAPSHSYAEAGTYPVTLTVTDDGGLVGALTRQVAVNGPGQVAVIARDSFERAVSDSWGSAEVGGNWTNTGSPSRYAVNGTAGTHTLAAGEKRQSYLETVNGDDVVASVDVSFDKAPTGGGIFTWLAVRTSGNEDYRARVRISGSSAVLYLQRQANGSDTTLSSTALTGLNYQVGDVIRIVLEAQGSSPTTLRAKAWKIGTPEPAGWLLTASDSAAALQNGGGVGLVSYLSGSATAVPMVSAFDNLVVETLAPVANRDPKAAFIATTSGLSVSTNASTSTDPDGTIVAYNWDFDGVSYSGPTASHVFPAAGTYQVTLSVVDNFGATGSVVQSVSVTDPIVGGVANDAFERSVSNGWGNADLGGAWNLDGTLSSFSVASGRGLMAIPQPGRSRGVSLPGVSVRDVEASADLAFDVAPTGGGGYHRLIMRQNGNDDYQLRLRLRPTDTSFQLIRSSSGSSTTLASYTLPGYVYQPGDTVHVRMSATGSGVTQLRGSVWVDNAVDPGWMLDVTDSTPSLQGAGTIAVTSYISGSAANTPTVVSVDDFVAVTP